MGILVKYMLEIEIHFTQVITKFSDLQKFRNAFIGPMICIWIYICYIHKKLTLMNRIHTR